MTNGNYQHDYQQDEFQKQLNEELDQIESEKRDTKQKVVAEEESNLSERSLKRAKLLGLSAAILAVISMSMSINDKIMNKTNNYEGTEYYKYQTVKPIVEDYYAIPEGYELNFIDGHAYAIKTITETMPATKKTFYTVPTGYVLQGNKGVKGDEVVDAISMTVYTAPEGWTLSGTTATRTTVDKIALEKEKTTIAPEGYILIGDKCYKIADYTLEEEQIKGR